MDLDEEELKETQKMFKKIKLSKKQIEEDIPVNTIYKYTQTEFFAVAKERDYQTRQAIIDYARERYPDKNVRVKFIDEEIANKIIELGTREYIKLYGIGGESND